MCAIRTLDERPSMFIGDRPILSSESMLRKDYYRQDEPIGGKPQFSSRSVREVLKIGPELVKLKNLQCTSRCQGMAGKDTAGWKRLRGCYCY
jgi:hypothetical protein